MCDKMYSRQGRRMAAHPIHIQTPSMQAHKYSSLMPARHCQVPYPSIRSRNALRLNISDDTFITACARASVSCSPLLSNAVWLQSKSVRSVNCCLWVASHWRTQQRPAQPPAHPARRQSRACRGPLPRVPRQPALAGAHRTSREPRCDGGGCEFQACLPGCRRCPATLGRTWNGAHHLESPRRIHSAHAAMRLAIAVRVAGTPAG
ncbi:hypothetical protein V8C86DRAFT_1042363 [Haematococcus lacustris]